MIAPAAANPDQIATPLLRSSGGKVEVIVDRGQLPGQVVLDCRRDTSDDVSAVGAGETFGTDYPVTWTWCSEASLPHWTMTPPSPWPSTRRLGAQSQPEMIRPPTPMPIVVAATFGIANERHRDRFRNSFRAC